MAVIIVSHLRPYRILAAGKKIKTLFGFGCKKLRGSYLQFLEGPETDSVLLHKMIKRTCSELLATQFQVVLYDKRGRNRDVMVSCSPFCNQGNGALVGCKLCMTASEALILGEVWDLFDAIPVPCALVSLDWPHPVRWTNRPFASMFGFPQDILSDCGIECLRPGDTDPAPWRNLLRAAAKGSAATAPLAARTGAGAAVAAAAMCLPVVEWRNGAIAYLAIAFADQNGVRSPARSRTKTLASRSPAPPTPTLTCPPTHIHRSPPGPTRPPPTLRPPPPTDRQPSPRARPV
jgi:hypothetical protein